MTIVASHLTRDGYSEREGREIRHDTEFAEIQYKSHEICSFAHCTTETLYQETSVSEPARIFQANTTVVQRTFLRGPEDSAILGRHATLDDESEAAMMASILDPFQTGKPLTRKQLLDTVHKDYNPRLTMGWLNAFVG
jgi:hypothetical protein